MGLSLCYYFELTLTDFGFGAVASITSVVPAAIAPRVPPMAAPIAVPSGPIMEPKSAPVPAPPATAAPSWSMWDIKLCEVEGGVSEISVWPSL